MTLLNDPARTAPVFETVPEHIAMVMDGNGRWANSRGLTRTEGHRAGERKRLWPSVVRELRDAEAMTAQNTGLTLTMAVNYGGRQELVSAVRSLAEDVAAGKVSPKSINEKSLQKRLYVPELPDVDMFLRSSGERRISNFMLWQSSYAELIFQDVLWPDFTRESMWEAIDEFGRRQRRFGAAEDAPLN